MGILWYRKKAVRVEDIMDVPECTKILLDLLNVRKSKNHPRIFTNSI